MSIAAVLGAVTGMMEGFGQAVETFKEFGTSRDGATVAVLFGPFYFVFDVVVGMAAGTVGGLLLSIAPAWMLPKVHVAATESLSPAGANALKWALRAGCVALFATPPALSLFAPDTFEGFLFDRGLIRSVPKHLTATQEPPAPAVHLAPPGPPIVRGVRVGGEDIHDEVTGPVVVRQRAAGGLELAMLVRGADVARLKKGQTLIVSRQADSWEVNVTGWLPLQRRDGAADVEVVVPTPSQVNDIDLSTLPALDGRIEVGRHQGMTLPTRAVRAGGLYVLALVPLGDEGFDAGAIAARETPMRVAGRRFVEAGHRILHVAPSTGDVIEVRSVGEGGVRPGDMVLDDGNEAADGTILLVHE